MNARLHFSDGRPGNRRGFTLIEVLVTLAIFILLTASVFGIMTAVFQSSNALKENQNRQDEVSALRAFLKNRFDSLGATDHLMTYARGDGDGMHVNGILMIAQSGSDAQAIDASRQPNGLYSLRLARPSVDDLPINLASFFQKVDKNVDALTWTSLIQDVKSIDWKFQSTSSPEWTDEWTGDTTKPALIECTVQLAGDAQPTVMDFSLPHLVASPSQAPVEAAANGT